MNNAGGQFISSAALRSHNLNKGRALHTQKLRFPLKGMARRSKQCTGLSASGWKIAWTTVVFALCLFMISASDGRGEELSYDTPFFSVGVDKDKGPAEPTVVLQIFLLMTVLSLAPAILIMLTSFTRIVIVLSLLRRALGTNQMPPNQVMVGLALFLTFFIMAPVGQQVNQDALRPYLEFQRGICR